MIINEFLNKKELQGEIVIYNSNIDISNKIVVVETTNPFMAPQLVNSIGLIVESGGLLSHTAIFARELNIPCVRIENATKLFKNGQKIEINEAGEVNILK